MTNKYHKLRLGWYHEYNNGITIGHIMQLGLYYGIKGRIILELEGGRNSHMRFRATINDRAIGYFDSAYDAELAIIKHARRHFKRSLKQLELR